MKRLILVFILIIILLPVAGFLLTAPLPPTMISGITVSHPETGTTQTYLLNEKEAAELSDGLQGVATNLTQKSSQESFEVKVHVKGLLSIPYHITVSEDKSVYLKRSWSRYVKSSMPQFFYTHESFALMYEHALPPVLGIISSEELFLPAVTEGSWMYQRNDDSWANTLPTVFSGITSAGLSSDSVTVPVITSMDSHPTISIDPLPDEISLQATDPAGTIRFNGPLNGNQLPLFSYNGLHHYELELKWTDEAQPYQGSYSTAFNVEMNLPPSYELPGPNVLQGELLEFRFNHVSGAAVPVIEQTLSDQLHFYQVNDGYVAYLPTNYDTAEGNHIIRYGLEGEPLMEMQINVKSRDFRIQHLSIDPSIEDSTRNEEAYAQSARYYAPSRDQSSPHRYYTEPFIMPVKGRLTTEFGETRYVNNAPTSYRHSGLDIAAPTGTPIEAVNRGRVVLAMDLILQGKTVVIDHGQGLFSVYFHMHEIHVEPDQMVERGEVIATVGSTGFSTGPHLHFTMSYYRHALEPGHFLVGEPITYQNAGQHMQ